MNSDKILEFINDLILIHSQIANDEMFLAGTNLIQLQQQLVKQFELAEKKEQEQKMKKCNANEIKICHSERFDSPTSNQEPH